MGETVRADKWLWATRFFKTRGLAAESCEGGRVKRAGHPLRPASSLHPGDRLDVPFHDGPGTRTIRVIALIERRVGAPQAQACYEELTPPEVLEANRAFLSEKKDRREGDQGRPTKRERRELDRIRGFSE